MTAARVLRYGLLALGVIAMCPCLNTRVQQVFFFVGVSLTNWFTAAFT